ncbi:MAG: hypothetical protein ABH871_07645 [Pseudomonadota bacterium]
MRYLFVMLALVFFMGCGGGGGDCSFSDPQTATYNLDDQTWNLTGTTPGNNCPAPVTTFNVSGTFTQSGNTLSVSGAGFTLTGEISGSQIKWGGSITVGGESLTIECTTMNVNGVDVGDTMTFTNSSWTVDYGEGTCSGTASGTFTRTS